MTEVNDARGIAGQVTLGANRPTVHPTEPPPMPPLQPHILRRIGQACYRKRSHFLAGLLWLGVGILVLEVKRTRRLLNQIPDWMAEEKSWLREQNRLRKESPESSLTLPAEFSNVTLHKASVKPLGGSAEISSPTRKGKEEKTSVDNAIY